MKKRLLGIIFAGVLAATALVGCADNKPADEVFETDVDSEGNTNSVVIDPAGAVDSLAATLDMNGAPIDAADFFDGLPDDCVGTYFMGSRSTADSMGVFKCDSADSVSAVSGIIDTYLADQKAEFERYLQDEVYKLDDVYVYQDSNYYIFVVNGDKTAAASAVDELLK